MWFSSKIFWRILNFFWQRTQFPQTFAVENSKNFQPLTISGFSTLIIDDFARKLPWICIFFNSCCCSIPQYCFLSNEIKSRRVKFLKVHYVPRAVFIPLLFFHTHSFSYKLTWCLLSGARKILIWFIIGMFADICLIAIGLNAYKHRSKKDLTPIASLRLLLQLNLNLFLIRIRYVCGSSRIPSHVSPGSNCTVISFSDFLIKIYSVRCN